MNFDETVREAKEGYDELREVDVPASLRRRVRVSVSEPQKPQVSGWVMAFAAVAALVGIGVFWWSTQSPTVTIPEPKTSPLIVIAPDGWSISEACDGERSETGLIATSPCAVSLTHPQIIATLDPGAELRAVEDPKKVRVKRGTVRFEAQTRADVRTILVSHGRIEIVGTEFVVTQKKDGGSVTLDEGKIRFVSEDDRTVEMTAGDVLTWPLEDPVVEVEEKPKEAPKVREKPKRVIAAKPNKKEVDALLVKVSELRSRRKYQKATSILRQAIREVETKNVEEKLSFELGSILTYQLKDQAAACKHWTSHEKRYRKTYASAISRARDSLSCP